MESNEGTTPSPPVNRSKTSVYTPCRRLGLSRKSPASSGSWKAPKSLSNLNSPSEIIFENKSKVVQEIIDGDVKNQNTPKRTCSSLSYKCQPLKIPKIVNSPIVARHIGGCHSGLSPKFKAPAVVKPASLEDSDSLPTDLTSLHVTEKMVQDLKRRIKRKEEELKDRKQAQIYKKKHDVKTIRMLIETWREGCQNALRELQSILRMQGHQFSLEEIINKYGFPHNLVRYSAENDDFE